MVYVPRAPPFVPSASDRMATARNSRAGRMITATQEIGKVDTTEASGAHDAWLFGWDTLPGIVSAWADQGGRALVWQRQGAEVHCFEDRFRPWLFAASLDDLRHL